MSVFIDHSHKEFYQQRSCQNFSPSERLLLAGNIASLKRLANLTLVSKYQSCQLVLKHHIRVKLLAHCLPSAEGGADCGRSAHL